MGQMVCVENQRKSNNSHRRERMHLMVDRSRGRRCCFSQFQIPFFCWKISTQVALSQEPLKNNKKLVPILSWSGSMSAIQEDAQLVDGILDKIPF